MKFGDSNVYHKKHLDISRYKTDFPCIDENFENCNYSVIFMGAEKLVKQNRKRQCGENEGKIAHQWAKMKC